MWMIAVSSSGSGADIQTENSIRRPSCGLCDQAPSALHARCGVRTAGSRYLKAQTCGRSISTGAAGKSLMRRGFFTSASPFCIALNCS